MKATLFDVNGGEKGKLDLPQIFSEKIRKDIVSKVIEAKKTKQPYGPSLMAGKQVSAKGKMRHRRHVWQTHYGRGMSRIPRKVMSRRGTQFNWVGAEVPFARGGMRAHPPKPISMINTLKINKKELKMAFASAISASASEKFIRERYERLSGEKNIKAPFVIESKITALKTKDLLKSIKSLIGQNLFAVAVKSKTQRAGRGKRRGRKYKTNAGMLLVLGDKETLKTGAFEVINAKNAGVSDFAKGGLGRLVVYTDGAIKSLGERFK